MTDEEKTADRIRRSNEELSRKAQSDTAIVRCAHFECVGLRGPDGVWRDTYGNVLNEVKIVSEL